MFEITVAMSRFRRNANGICKKLSNEKYKTVFVTKNGKQHFVLVSKKEFDRNQGIINQAKLSLTKIS